MSDEERKFIKKVNIDKAKRKTNIAIGLIVLSLFTYIMPLFWGNFDFGIVFEIASLVFLLIARSYMSQYDERKSKTYIICSMVSIGWILIYDTIIFISSIRDFSDLIVFTFDFLLVEVVSILYLIILFLINKDLSKADNPTKYKESTDWFYEKYEEKKGK